MSNKRVDSIIGDKTVSVKVSWSTIKAVYSWLKRTAAKILTSGD